MKILIATDSFKGSLSAFEACSIIASAFGDEASTVCLPLGDGGEGSLDAFVKNGARLIEGKAVDAYGNEITASYAVLGETAIIEAAQTCGLTMLQESERNPLLTDSRGVGLQIGDALKLGCKKIIVCVGGTSVNDGGVGMAYSLGYRFFDKKMNEIPFGGAGAQALCKISDNNYCFKNKAVIIAATDVKNPLCGENGASPVYSPQKGATPEEAQQLDKALMNLSAIVFKDMGIEISSVPGGGAGGGLGAGLYAFCGASFISGFDCIADSIGFQKKLKECDAVITGEGKTDSQTKYGKLPYKVLEEAKKENKPCYIISGRVLDDHGLGIRSDRIFAAADAGMSDAYAIENAGTLLFQAAKKLSDKLK